MTIALPPLDDRSVVCSRCKTAKGVALFPRSRIRKNGVGAWCTDCMKLWARTDGKSSRKASHLRIQLRNRRSIREWKAAHPCVTCGEARPAALDFHHLDPTKKLWHIGRMANLNKSLATIRAEIAKCVVICANCHRVLHENESKE